MIDRDRAARAGVEVAEDGGVATVTFARPERRNALTFDGYRALSEIFEALTARGGARAAILTGRGESFCAGGDRELIIDDLVGRDADELAAFAELTCRAVRSIREFPAPVIAAIDGPAVGAGAVLAAACDLRVASRSAQIGFVFPRVGLSGADMGAAWLLPRIVGLGNAAELLYFGHLIGAEEARRIGLVTRVTDAPEDAARIAREWAEMIAQGPATAHATTKAALAAEADMPLSEALAAEARAQAHCMAHPDFREARAAAREGRPPAFRGAPGRDEDDE